MSATQQDVIWVEVLSRHREVLARHRCSGDVVRIGRAYDNDVIVDDPYVAQHHLRIVRDSDGMLVAEDAGSAHGMFIDGGKHKAQRVVLNGDQALRIGRTLLRARTPDHAVAEERGATSAAQSWLMALALCGAFFGFGVLNLWLGETVELQFSRYILPLVSMAFFVLMWSAAWAVLSRIFTGHAYFERHLIIALSGVLAFMLFSEAAEFGGFALSLGWLTEYAFAGSWLIFAAVCFFHLREIGPRLLRLKAGMVGALAVGAIALQMLAQSELRSNTGQQAYLRQLKPPGLRLTPPQSENAFFADVEKIQARLDKARKEEPNRTSLLPSFDFED